MPLTGMTGARLREHLRKYIPYYLIGIVLMLVGTNLLYTTTAPRVPYEQQVLVYLADSVSYVEPMEPLAERALEYGQTVDDTLRSVEFQSMMFIDPEQDYTGSVVLTARLSLGEVDAVIACAKCAEAMAKMGAFLPLDDIAAGGWMADLGLEPWYWTDEETGETALAGFCLDSVTELARMGAMNNEGAVLMVTGNGTNQETTLKVLEYIVGELKAAAAD